MQSNLTSSTGALRAGLLLLPALAGCGGPSGRAGPDTLVTATLADWAARVPSRQPVVRDAEFVSTVWVDYTLLAQAAERGEALADSATMADALFPDLALVTLRRWHDTLVARRGGVAADVPDSLYAGDAVRVFQHILLRVSDPNDLSQVSAVRARADSILEMARTGGGGFADLARTRSEDSASAPSGGYLPVAPRGLLPPEFERAAWQLKPDVVGGVGSRLGFHIVRRPLLEEVRSTLRQYADSLATRRADSLHLDSLVTGRRLAVTKSAVPVLRRFFQDAVARSDSTALATWDGGQISLVQIAPWIDLLPPRGYLDLRGASDLALEGFVKEMAQQHLLMDEAKAAGMAPDDADRLALADAYRRGLQGSLDLLGMTDSAARLQPGQGRDRVAALLNRLTQDSVRWRPLPSGLGSLLRARAGYRLHQAGIEAAATAARKATAPAAQ
jgi:hypothetical protein